MMEVASGAGGQASPGRAGENKQLRRRALLAVAGGVVLLPASYVAYAWLTYPSDRTPEGAYLRVMSAVNSGSARDLFHYTETEAQHACYTVRDFRKQARDSVSRAYPEPERTRLTGEYQPFADAPDGQDVFAIYAERRGYLARLRRDLSGIAKIEASGPRASVQTVKGTRYPFRRRENGMWGLTLFTAELSQEARRAARDAALVKKAASDYERAAKHDAKK
jgi:hypothetical protein